MQVREWQNKIIKFIEQWDKKRKITPSEQETFNHLVEEVGEIARQLVNKDSRQSQFKPDELNNAIADTLMQLVKLAYLRGLDIEELILKIIEDEQKFLGSK